MADSPGRGGSPSGFIGRSTSSDLYGRRASRAVREEERGRRESRGNKGNKTKRNGHDFIDDTDDEGEGEFVNLAVSASLVNGEDKNDIVWTDLRKSGIEPGDMQARVLG